MTTLQALELAITALNDTPNFATTIPDQSRPGRNLTSYDLIAQISKVVRSRRRGPDKLYLLDTEEVDLMVKLLSTRQAARLGYDIKDQLLETFTQ
jgi:hypothetical protein